MRTNQGAAVALCLAALCWGAGAVTLDAGRDPLAAQPEFPTVDEAFVLSWRLDGDRVVARWTVADCCYLYRHGFSVRSADGGDVGPLDIPDGERVMDGFFGETEVYRGSVEIGVRLAAAPVGAVTVRIGYQGCAEAGLCYPPQTRTVTLNAGGDQAARDSAIMRVHSNTTGGDAVAKLLVLHGPNLNLLGTREPGLYGSDTLDSINAGLVAKAGAAGHDLATLQSNAEHELVDAVQGAKADGVDFIVINPAAFTHTSVALRDAFLAVDIPFIEVHLSNVHAREPFRRYSYFSDIARGVIAGLGAAGYAAALDAAIASVGD